MISVEQAQSRLLALAPPPVEELIGLSDAHGRVLMHPVVASRAQPPFASSAMDGYAVIDDGRTHWTVIGESAAGAGYFDPIGAGQAVRIFTGAPVPPGADRIVIQEDVDRVDDGIRLRGGADTARYIRPAGGDFEAGFVFEAPRLIGPAELSLLAAMNAAAVTVARRPKVVILSTGDELVQPGESPAPDQIIASNAIALAALVRNAGADPQVLPIAKDRETSLMQAFGWAENADIIVTIGGASVGDHDLVGAVARKCGFVSDFYKVAMRPGKPLMAGQRANTVHLGLPGNPVSALVCGVVYLAPLIRKMLGLTDVYPEHKKAQLGVAAPANGPRAHYMRAFVQNGIITPFDRQDSSLMHLLPMANALLIRPPNAPELKKDDPVHYIDF